MTPTTRVAVIGGGRNCEHDVSLASAAAVADALEQAGYHAVRLTIDPAGVWRDREDRPIGLAGAVRRPAFLRGGFPGTARSAR